MTAFESVGCNMQYNARNPKDAARRFSRSCVACCSIGRNADCDRCPIAATHQNMLAGFREELRAYGHYATC